MSYLLYYGFCGTLLLLLVGWYLALRRTGRQFIGGLTLLHTLRVPVEFVLYGLYLQHGVPRAMTFEGGNLDILSGLTAPLAYVFGMRRPRRLFWWNVACLVLLLNVSSRGMRAIFSQTAPALVHFPFFLLPALVVPLVMLAQIVAIWRLFPRKLAPDAA